MYEAKECLKSIGKWTAAVAGTLSAWLLPILLAIFWSWWAILLYIPSLGAFFGVLDHVA